MTKLNLIAESGQPKARLEAWRDEFYRCEDVWHAFGREIGALRFYNAPFQAPRSFAFPEGAVPEGWRKPDSKGVTWPMKKSADWLSRLSALPAPEFLDEVCRDLGLPTSLTYGDTEGSHGSRYLAWSASWPENGPVILHGEDFIAVARSLSESHGTVTFNAGGAAIPEGFASVSAARVDYVFAKAQLEAEEARQEQTDDAPAPC